MVGCGTINFPLKRQRTLGSQSPSFLALPIFKIPRGMKKVCCGRNKLTYIKKMKLLFEYVASTTTNTKFLFLVDVRTREERNGWDGLWCAWGKERRNKFLFICFNFCIPVSKQKINRFQWKLFVSSSQNNKYRTTSRQKPTDGHWRKGLTIWN